MALLKEQWLEIKVKWETGSYTMQNLADEYGISKVAISKKIKKEQWESARTRKIKKSVIEKVNELIDSSNEIKHVLQGDEANIFKTEVLKDLSASLMADNVRLRLLYALYKGIGQIENVIDANPSGVYVKEQKDNGIVYERNTLFIKDLMYILKELNSTVEGVTPSTAVVVNNNSIINNPDDKPSMAVNFIAK